MSPFSVWVPQWVVADKAGEERWLLRPISNRLHYKAGGFLLSKILDRTFFPFFTQRSHSFCFFSLLPLLLLTLNTVSIFVCNKVHNYNDNCSLGAEQKLWAHISRTWNIAHGKGDYRPCAWTFFQKYIDQILLLRPQEFFWDSPS